MDKIKKKLIVTMMVLFIAFGILPQNANASDFSGTTNGTSWSIISGEKKMTNTVVYLDWKTSNKASHRQWFRIRQHGVVRGDKLLNYLGNGFISGNIAKGIYSELSSKRENIIDPNTYITGSWLH